MTQYLQNLTPQINLSKNFLIFPLENKKSPLAKDMLLKAIFQTKNKKT